MPQAFLAWDTSHVFSMGPCCDDHRQPRRCGQSCSPGCTSPVLWHSVCADSYPGVRRRRTLPSLCHSFRTVRRAGARRERTSLLSFKASCGQPIPNSAAATPPSFHTCGLPSPGSVAGASHRPPATPYARATEPTRRRERTSDGEYGPRGCRPRAFRCVLASRAPRPARLPPPTGTFRAAGCVSFRAGAFDAVGDSNPVPERVTCPRPHRNVPARAGCPRPRHLAGRPWIPSHWYGEWAGPDYRCSQ